uniref:Uncharacterized protein n=1 Tax=Plectus sambesii TaxID=2011161 RepID=A0A914UJU9_9BILA
MPTPFATAVIFSCCIAAVLSFHLQGAPEENRQTMMRLLDSPRNIHAFSTLALQRQQHLRFADAHRNRLKKWYDWGDGLAVNKKWYDWQDVPLATAVSSSNGKRDDVD